MILSPLHLHVSAKETKTLRCNRTCNWSLFLQCHCQTMSQKQILTCFKEMGNVSFPDRSGVSTSSLVISLQVLQTAAHATTCFRMGQTLSLASIRWITSRRSSGGMLAQQLCCCCCCSWDSAFSWVSSSTTPLERPLRWCLISKLRLEMLPIPPFISWNSRIKLLRGIKDDFWPPDMLLEVWTHTLPKPLHPFFWRCLKLRPSFPQKDLLNLVNKEICWVAHCWTEFCSQQWNLCWVWQPSDNISLAHWYLYQGTGLPHLCEQTTPRLQHSSNRCILVGSQSDNDCEENVISYHSISVQQVSSRYVSYPAGVLHNISFFYYLQTTISGVGKQH